MRRETKFVALSLALSLLGLANGTRAIPPLSKFSQAQAAGIERAQAGNLDDFMKPPQESRAKIGAKTGDEGFLIPPPSGNGDDWSDTSEFEIPDASGDWVLS